MEVSVRTLVMVLVPLFTLLVVLIGTAIWITRVYRVEIKRLRAETAMELGAVSHPVSDADSQSLDGSQHLQVILADSSKGSQNESQQAILGDVA